MSDKQQASDESQPREFCKPFHSARIMNRFRFFVNLSLLLCCVNFCIAQTPVSLAPVPQLQFLNSNGTPLAFGCVFTYQSTTNLPLATYTDFTGTVQNPNPVILTQTGSANIWLQSGVAYRFTVRSAGGTNCSLGTTMYTVDGIGGGVISLTTIVPYSATPVFAASAQNQLFQITLTGNASAQPLTAVGITPPAFFTFEITQDSAGGHTWSWPSNTVGGATICATANCTTLQMFEWDGLNAVAVGGATFSTPAFSFVSIYDAFLSPLGVVCTDANRQLTTSCSGVSGTVTFNGQSVPFGGSGNVNASAATHSVALNEGNGNAMTGVALGADQILKGAAGADPTAYSVPACPDTDGEHTNYVSGTGFTCGATGSVGTPQRAVLSSPVSLTGNLQQTVLSKAVTFPATTGTYRAIVSYTVYITAGANACFAEAIDSTNTVAYAASGQNSNGTGYIGLTGTEVTSGTYSQGAAVTFHLDVECNNGAGGLGSATVNMNNAALFTMSPAEVTYISITPVLAH